MFDNNLLLAFALMAILFLRQISILKHPNKINYAPLMIGVGAISSVVHFIIHPDATNVILLLRESFLPLLVSLFLYIVMNILHQTQQTQSAKIKDEFAGFIASHVSELKEFMVDLENRMILSQQEDREAQKDLRERFKQDIKALNAIELNQDNVVLKHIEILRDAEQDHYEQTKETLQKALENKYDVSEDIESLKENLISMRAISDDIARAITKYTIEQLSGITKAFEDQIVSLKSHTEGVSTALYEGENRLNSIREQSEMIMQQMVLSSKKMNELEEKNSGLHDIYTTIKDLVEEIEHIKADYVKSQAQLSSIVDNLSSAQEEEISSVREQMEGLIVILTKKIDNSLDKLHEHYHIASQDITNSVQVLAKKAQLKGYTDLK